MDNSCFLKNSCSDFHDNYQFNGIDIIKFICAFLICIIHINPFQTDIYGLNLLYFWLKNYICRIAVPFYFASSGFLLFRKIDIYNLNPKRIKKYCFKILRLLGTWTCLLFVDATTWQLWYLGALVVAVIILSFLIKKGIPLQFILYISCGLFFIGLLGDSYYGFIEPLKTNPIFKVFIAGYETVFSTTRNGVFFGLIFVLIGVLFAHKHIVIKKAFSIVGLIISLMLMAFEVYLLKSFSNPKDYSMLLSLLPVSFFLFYIVTHIKLKNRPIYAKLRIIGVLVFFIHLIINYFVRLMIIFVHKNVGINLIAFQFTITMCLSLFVAIVIERLSKKARFCWLKYLFS